MPRYLVRWEIDVEEEEVSTPEQAAAYVWQRYFGRQMPPEPDSCCVFDVAVNADPSSAFEPVFETVDLEDISEG